MSVAFYSAWHHLLAWHEVEAYTCKKAAPRTEGDPFTPSVLLLLLTTDKTLFVKTGEVPENRFSCPSPFCFPWVDPYGGLNRTVDRILPLIEPYHGSNRTVDSKRIECAPHDAAQRIGPGFARPGGLRPLQGVRRTGETGDRQTDRSRWTDKTDYVHQAALPSCTRVMGYAGDARETTLLF